MSDFIDPVITSKQNNLVKYIRRLRDKRTRDTEKRIVLEGVKLISEAVGSGFFPEKTVVSERAMGCDRVRDLLARAGTGQVFAVSDAVIDYICETDTPQGIAAVVRMPETGFMDIKLTSASFLVVLDNVQDPGNVGAIVRTADAFGANAVILTKGCADLFNSKTLRSSMGSAFHIPAVREVTMPQLTGFLRENGLYTAATGIGESAIPIHTADLRRPLAIVFGNEGVGISSEIAAFTDIVLKIPMTGLAESLNVAVAAGVVLYEAFRQCGSRAK